MIMAKRKFTFPKKGFHINVIYIINKLKELFLSSSLFHTGGNKRNSSCSSRSPPGRLFLRLSPYINKVEITANFFSSSWNIFNPSSTRLLRLGRICVCSPLVHVFPSTSSAIAPLLNFALCCIIQLKGRIYHICYGVNYSGFPLTVSGERSGSGK